MRQVTIAAAWFTLAITWYSVANAATLSFEQSLRGISLFSGLCILGLCLLGGIAKTFQCLSSSVTITTTRAVVIETGKNLSGALVAGVMMFCVGEWQEWHPWLTCATITASAWGGSLVLDKALSFGFRFYDRKGI